MVLRICDMDDKQIDIRNIINTVYCIYKLMGVSTRITMPNAFEIHNVIVTTLLQCLIVLTLSSTCVSTIKHCNSTCM